ncbi:MAG: biopolymer transporter ExbD [Flavobacteriales bacterium]|nr:biopolymer transporter ExbD [Flavobacteriales bacterium]MBK7555796.1 biopolymer transporter ExbD [Flavobacteriales bacterium]
MSDIQERPISDRAKRRSSPHRIHLDMAPMVDLAFLLLTFFMLTTRLIKPTAMELDFPKTGTGGETANILTVLLDDRGRVFAYQGTLEQGGQPMRHLSDKNLRATLLAFNQMETDSAAAPAICVLKTGRHTKYGRVIHVADAVQQVRLARFSIQDSLTTMELEQMAEATATASFLD